MNLVDGSKVAALPSALRSVGGRLVRTTASVLPARAAKAALESCDRSLRLPPGRQVVARVGVTSETLTFRDGHDLRACDRDRQAVPEIGGRWCGVSAGRLNDGRLRDSRLDLCQDRKGHPVAAFGWIEPLGAARWILVDQSGYKEVYRVTGGLPVRVATARNIDPDTSSTVFVYEQYTADGLLLSSSTLQAAVAG
jgi:hypothetical protein